MFLLGMTTVTFRKLSADGNIALAKNAALDGIEWGGDIHVPAGDMLTAQSVYKSTVDAGLRVFSYGSYFRPGECADVQKEFQPVLDSARGLHAHAIRIWAGAKASAESDDAYFEKVALQTQQASDMAQEFGIKVCFEYHPNTLTDHCETALALLQKVDRENCRTYWQPRYSISLEENLRELQTILPYLENVHVYSVKSNGERLPFEEGYEEWSRYLELIRTDNKSHKLILEFVKDDSEAQFLEDAKALIKLVRG